MEVKTHMTRSRDVELIKEAYREAFIHFSLYDHLYIIKMADLGLEDYSGRAIYSRKIFNWFERTATAIVHRMLEDKFSYPSLPENFCFFPGANPYKAFDPDCIRPFCINKDNYDYWAFRIIEHPRVWTTSCGIFYPMHVSLRILPYDASCPCYHCEIARHHLGELNPEANPVINDE